MRKNKNAFMILSLILIYALMIISVLLKSKPLILITVALFVFRLAVKSKTEAKIYHPTQSEYTVQNGSARFIKIFIVIFIIPFLAAGIGIAAVGFIQEELFLVIFGAFFFVIPLIILVMTSSMLKRARQISFDEDENGLRDKESTRAANKEIYQTQMPLSDDPHQEHDEFIQSYSAKNKACYEEKTKPKKKKKFRLFNEPEWDDENSDIDL